MQSCTAVDACCSAAHLSWLIDSTETLLDHSFVLHFVLGHAEHMHVQIWSRATEHIALSSIYTLDALSPTYMACFLHRCISRHERLARNAKVL